jgi:hypothetical protein
LVKTPMLVYQATKREFMDDVEANAIADHITAALPDGCGVAIEFNVLYTSSRIDFLLTGRQDGARDAAVIVELD